MKLSLFIAPAMACLAIATTARAQVDYSAIRNQNFMEYGVPDPGLVPNAYFQSSALNLPPSPYIRRATPSGLAAGWRRRLKWTSIASGGRALEFAPTPYQYRAPVASGYWSNPEYSYQPFFDSASVQQNSLPAPCPHCGR